MSFEDYRLKGRISTILMVSIPIILGISIVLLSLLGLAPSIFLSLIFVIPNYGIYILFLVAMKGFAKYYNDPEIFKNCLYAFIVSLIGGIISFIFTFSFFIPIINQISPSMPNLMITPSQEIIWSIIQAFISIWAIVSIIGILNGLFYRRTFYALAEKSGEHNFKQAGLFMFIGGILMLIAVGGLLFFIGLIFAILGFSSMKPKLVLNSQTESDH